MQTILLIIVTYLLIGLTMYYVAYMHSLDSILAVKQAVEKYLGQQNIDWLNNTINGFIKKLDESMMLYDYILLWPINVYKGIMIKRPLYPDQK